MSAAAGSLALGGGFHGALAQAAKRIERLDPGLDAIIDTSQPIRELASGLGGELGPAEGPVWWKEGGYLLFSDIGNNRRMKYTPGQGVTVFKEKTNQANGLTRDLQGRLIACEHETRRVTRQELDGRLHQRPSPRSRLKRRGFLAVICPARTWVETGVSTLRCKKLKSFQCGWADSLSATTRTERPMLNLLFVRG
jgi:SMP-30/Gluconolactonase/LRE-like region